MSKLLVLTYLMQVGDGGAAISKMEYDFASMQECQAHARIFKRQEQLDMDERFRIGIIANRTYCIKQPASGAE
jgi:hypothetical protein